MKIFNYGDTINENTVATIGMFDGVHRGHKLLIKRTIEIAEKKNAMPLVYTFFNHPVKERKRKFITLLEEKLFLMEKIGVQFVYLVELNDDFMHLSPEAFFKEEIVKRIHAKGIVIGEDFRFGCERKGDVVYMKKLAEPSHIEVYSVPLLRLNSKIVSSSLIHNFIVSGDMENANNALGYAFFLTGSVVKGKGIGRLLGFPTANILYKNGNKVLPHTGIYVTVAETDGKLFRSITNVGFNPTFENNNKVKVEIHFIGVKKDLYGANVRLYFLQKIRDEKKFATPELLVQQIHRDVEKAKIYFRLHNFKKYI